MLVLCGGTQKQILLFVLAKSPINVWIEKEFAPPLSIASLVARPPFYLAGYYHIGALACVRLYVVLSLGGLLWPICGITAH